MLKASLLLYSTLLIFIIPFATISEKPTEIPIVPIHPETFPSIIKTETIDLSKDYQDFSSVDYQIFGYSVDLEAAEMIVQDLTANLILSKSGLNQINVKMILNSGIYEYKDMTLSGMGIYDKNEMVLTRIYEVREYRLGFFMDINVEENVTKVCVSCDGGDKQLCYMGVIPIGFLEKGSSLTSEIEGVSIDTTYEELKNNLIESRSFEDEKQKIMEDHMNGISIQRKEPQDGVPQASYMSPTNIGLVHNCFLSSSSFNWVQSNNPPSVSVRNEMLQSGITVDIGRLIYTEAQVLSDIAAYNKDIYDFQQGDYIQRYDVRAYHMLAAGDHLNQISPAWCTGYLSNPLFWWITSGSWWTHHTEISNIWDSYSQGYQEIYIDATGMIVYSKSCFSYSRTTSGTNPRMAEAFVDDGNAAAYIGPAGGPDWCSYTRDLTGVGYPIYTKGFWENMADGTTIYTAVQDVIEGQNYYYDIGSLPGGPLYRWVYGTHYRIYGSTSAKLP